MNWNLAWETYKTIAGVVSLVVVAIIVVGVVGLLVWWFFTVPRCPRCGSGKFQLMVGGPPKCRKCGWQRKFFLGKEEDPANREIKIIAFWKQRFSKKS